MWLPLSHSGGGGNGQPLPSAHHLFLHPSLVAVFNTEADPGGLPSHLVQSGKQFGFKMFKNTTLTETSCGNDNNILENRKYTAYASL